MPERAETKVAMNEGAPLVLIEADYVVLSVAKQPSAVSKLHLYIAQVRLRSPAASMKRVVAFERIRLAGRVLITGTALVLMQRTYSTLLNYNAVVQVVALQASVVEALDLTS